MTTSAIELQRHARTYHGFMLAVKWFCIHLATLLTLLVLWFATPPGFGGGLAAAIVVFAVAVWVMNHGLAHSTENDNGELAAAERAERRPAG